MSAKKPIINLIMQDELWTRPKFSWKKEITRALNKAAETLREDFSKQEVSIVLTNDQIVQNLNKTFRHKDRATNVLSFPSAEEGELGDIILGGETVMREAQEAGILCHHHTLHLIIHGFLHLLGYDHENEIDAHKMESMEIQILKDLNIKNPYEAL